MLLGFFYLITSPVESLVEKLRESGSVSLWLIKGVWAGGVFSTLAATSNMSREMPPASEGLSRALLSAFNLSQSPGSPAVNPCGLQCTMCMAWVASETCPPGTDLAHTPTLARFLLCTYISLLTYLSQSSVGWGCVCEGHPTHLPKEDRRVANSLYHKPPGCGKAKEACCFQS